MKTTTLGLAAAIALLSGGASLAQQPPAGQPGSGPHARMMRPDPAQMHERRAQQLRDILQLRADQEPALKAFLDASRPTGERMGRRGPPPGATRALTTPERLDRQQARMAERQAAFERRAQATRRFYAQLSPSQQKAFDALGSRGERQGRDHDGSRGMRG